VYSAPPLYAEDEASLYAEEERAKEDESLLPAEPEPSPAAANPASDMEAMMEVRASERGLSACLPVCLSACLPVCLCEQCTHW
jgi:hypothetical protein